MVSARPCHGALLPGALVAERPAFLTNSTNGEATLYHVLAEEIGNRCQAEPGLVRTRTKPENNPNERSPHSNDLV